MTTFTIGTGKKAKEVKIIAGARVTYKVANTKITRTENMNGKIARGVVMSVDVENNSIHVLPDYRVGVDYLNNVQAIINPKTISHVEIKKAVSNKVSNSQLKSAIKWLAKVLKDQDPANAKKHYSTLLTLGTVDDVQGYVVIDQKPENVSELDDALAWKLESKTAATRLAKEIKCHAVQVKTVGLGKAWFNTLNLIADHFGVTKEMLDSIKQVSKNPVVMGNIAI